MPVSRLTAEGLSAEVAAAYARAEVRLLQLIGKHLAAGTESPQWAEAKLAELQVFRRRASKIVEAATAEAVGQTATATQTAYLRGAAAGEGELGALGVATGDLAPKHAEHAVEALVRAQAGTLEAMAPQIVRSAADGYRDAVTRASTGTLTGASTRLQDAQVALDDLARQGLSGFTDKAGRRWGLQSYVDMATRTTTAQAAVVGHMDRLEQAGVSLFIVSDSPRECDVCRKWEGKVLTRGPEDVVATNAVTGKTEQVRVDGTVQRAISAGLFHPNCTHNLSAYVHGATKRGAATADPKGNAEKVHQRHLERKVREWKRREAAAITPEAARAAKSKVREWQARVAEHTKSTGLPRKSHRESFDVKLPGAPVAKVTNLAPLEHVDAEVIDTEMADLMAGGDFGPRFEQLAAELDRRDQAAGRMQPTLGTAPDPVAEQAAVNRVMFGSDYDYVPTSPKVAKKRTRDQELRDEYDTWVYTQWLRAEEETRGNLLSKRAEFDGVDVVDIFTRRLSLKHASPELQEWFAQPGNARMSFPEFRAGIMDDKAAREARHRVRNRGYESEFG